MARKVATLATSLLWLTGILSAQGLNTIAKQDDWEDINFEFNSPILSDGYPSLLRLAELLNKNPEYKVSLIGNADHIGSHPYNDQLGRKRAEAVKAFLEKYGARARQVNMDSKGARSPKVSNGTPEGRFMNRRVEMVVTDGAGKIMGAVASMSAPTLPIVCGLLAVVLGASVVRADGSGRTGGTCGGRRT